MPENSLEFETKTMKVIIDYGKCEPARKNTANPLCGFACVKADRMYDRAVLRIEGNRPVLTGSLNDAKRTPMNPSHGNMPVALPAMMPLRS